VLAARVPQEWLQEQPVLQQLAPLPQSGRSGAPNLVPGDRCPMGADLAASLVSGMTPAVAQRPGEVWRPERYRFSSKTLEVTPHGVWLCKKGLFRSRRDARNR
jgi:hypothetical protein